MLKSGRAELVKFGYFGAFLAFFQFFQSSKKNFLVGTLAIDPLVIPENFTHVAQRTLACSPKNLKFGYFGAFWAFFPIFPIVQKNFLVGTSGIDLLVIPENFTHLAQRT